MKDLLDFDYPYEPGWRDPDTSRKAAEEIKEGAENLRAKVYDELKKAPASVHQMAKRLDLPVSSVQPRFSELVAQCRIAWDGHTVANPTSGKSAKVWRVTGRTEL